jgi:hypothetical protein
MLLFVAAFVAGVFLAFLLLQLFLEFFVADNEATKLHR